MRNGLPPASVTAVILDLDGTLIDTASEIGLALSRTLEEFGVEPLPQRDVTALIGRGVRSLVERSLETRAVRGIDVEAVVARFHSHYTRTVATEARLYPGAREGIDALREAGRRIAVVTNKPRTYSERLLAYTQVAASLDAIVAGDDGITRKPAGDMLLAACGRMKVRAEQTLMVGDSDNDVLAARAAGCLVWCVPYGYNEGRSADTLECDRVVATIEEAARLVIAMS